MKANLIKNMEVPFTGGLIGNSGLLQKESLNGSTTQMVESRGEKKKRKDFNKTSSQNLTGVVLLRYQLTMNALQSTFGIVQD